MAVEDTDPYTIRSPWGAVAGFFLIQCFGFVTLHGFRMFVNIGISGADSLSAFNANDWADRVLLPFWGFMWILVFIATEVDIFRRLSAFWREKQILHFAHALRYPSEIAKSVVAFAFAAAFVMMMLGHYPFPQRPISLMVSALFWMFGWGVSALVAWGMRSKTIQTQPHEEGHTAGAIMGFGIGAVFFVVAYFLQPGLFYFHGMIGLGVMTMIACQVLFKGPKIKGFSSRKATKKEAVQYEG